MGRKRNPVLPIFTRDILSSPRCRALSEQAAGIYFFLLCRLNEPPTPGAYRLSDWEEHANWSRSKTTRCLAEPDKYSRLQYFAKMLSVNDLPWRERDILESLQELYNRGIITVVGDALIQPRMFADNGFTLDAEGTILDDPHSGSMALRGDDAALKTADKNTDFLSINKGTKKVHKKVPKKVHEKADEALTRIRAGENPEEALGDLLFACVSAARLANAECETLLLAATEKFIQRYTRMESRINRDKKELKSLTLQEKDVYWKSSKQL